MNDIIWAVLCFLCLYSGYAAGSLVSDGRHEHELRLLRRHLSRIRDHVDCGEVPNMPERGPVL